MEGRGWIGRHGFWALALLWLPAGIVAQAAVRLGPDAVAADRLGPWLATMAMEGLSLAPFVPCGLPLPAPDADPGRSAAAGSGGSATGAAPGPRASRSARRRWRRGCSGRSLSRSAPSLSGCRSGSRGGGLRGPGSASGAGEADRRRRRAGCAAGKTAQLRAGRWVRRSRRRRSAVSRRRRSLAALGWYWAAAHSSDGRRAGTGPACPRRMAGQARASSDRLRSRGTASVPCNAVWDAILRGMPALKLLLRAKSPGLRRPSRQESTRQESGQDGCRGVYRSSADWMGPA